MDKKRKVYAPFSLTSEAGVAQTPVEGYIDVNQTVYPIVDTGTVNENGKWVGVKASDDEFIGFTKAVQVADAGVAVFPDTNNHPSINMEGFTNLQLAMKVSNGGNYRTESIMGPDTVKFLNLSPIIAAGVDLRICSAEQTSFSTAIVDSAESLSTTWRVFTLFNRAAGQNNLQFRITNNSGGASDIEFAFRRLV